jgi:hypothetical protein
VGFWSLQFFAFTVHLVKFRLGPISGCTRVARRVFAETKNAVLAT